MVVSTPTQGLTVEEFCRLADEGAFGPNAQVELVDGEVFEMLPVGPFHSNATRRLANYFARLGGERWLVDMQNPVLLNNRSQPQPDFTLLRPLDVEYDTRHPGPRDIILLVEVSESSLRFDRGRKLVAYAKAGIKEYWIVNLLKRRVEIYREPSPDGSYASVTRKQGDDLIAPAGFPDATMRVADLLGA